MQYKPLDNGLPFEFSFAKFSSKQKESGQIPVVKIAILVLNLSPISVVFPIVRFAWDQKTVLTGESLYCGFCKIFW